MVRSTSLSFWDCIGSDSDRVDQCKVAASRIKDDLTAAGWMFYTWFFLAVLEESQRDELRAPERGAAVVMSAFGVLQKYQRANAITVDHLCGAIEWDCTDQRRLYKAWQIRASAGRR